MTSWGWAWILSKVTSITIIKMHEMSQNWDTEKQKWNDIREESEGSRGRGACYLQRMHHSDRGINKIVQFSNIRTQQRIICAQFMFMPPQSPHSSLHKSQELECRDDNIVQATSELQHSWIWYEATFCDKKYPGPGSRNPAPGRLRRPRHAMDNSSEHNYNYRKSSFSQGQDLLTKFSFPLPTLASWHQVVSRSLSHRVPCPESEPRLVISPPYKAPPPSKYLVMFLSPSLPCPLPEHTHVKINEVSDKKWWVLLSSLLLAGVTLYCAPVLKTALTREYWWGETQHGPKHFRLRCRSSGFLIPSLHHINDV